jgi:hypothetical protein
MILRKPGVNLNKTSTPIHKVKDPSVEGEKLKK